jgi:hypothetical protein
MLYGTMIDAGAVTPKALRAIAGWLTTRSTVRTMIAAALGVTALASVSLAEIVDVPGGIAVKESTIAIPTAGMSMDEVAAKFGTPAQKIPAVGKPPISRWAYPGFIVYFEYTHVIHSVVANS